MISNVVVITIVKSSGIAVISSTQFLMTSKHKIGPKFTQQGRIDFISNFTISNRMLLMFSIVESFARIMNLFDIVVQNYYSSLKNVP